MCGFVGFVDPKKLFNNFETINQIKLMSKKSFTGALTTTNFGLMDKLILD